jgi:membrane-bound serine protease (ClpP class)
MVKKLFLLLLVVFLTILPGSASVLAEAPSGERSVYVVPLDGPVEKGLFRYLQRTFREAGQSGAEAIILEINTPGGTLEAAFDISKLILDSPVPVYAYVRYDALSAGAFLALSCRAFYMAPGSAIGAAEPRGMGGEELVDEKLFSAWEAKMRSAAVAQGKDGQVAAAMVSKDIAIEGIIEEGKLLTLTDREALEIGFTDGIVSSRAQLLDTLGLSGAELVEINASTAEQLARFITHPTVATLIITIAFAALVIEVMTAGFGVAGTISIMAFALYFGGHIFAGLAGREVIFLFLLGFILLLIEAFIPNFGVIGLSGLAAIVASVVLSAATTGEGLRILVMSLFLSVIVIAFSFRFLRRSPLWSQIVLQYAETRDRGYVGPGDASSLVGEAGVTLTPLRPAGMAEINGKRVDVVSEGGYIASGVEIKVVFTEGSRVVVRPQ